MRNTIDKVRPEVKEDEEFQKGLKIITKIQIWLFVLLAAFNILIVFIIKLPINFQLFYQLVMRCLFISLLASGFKKLLIAAISLNVMGVMVMIIMFVTNLYRFNIFGILINILEIIFVLSYIMSGIIILNLKETKYVVTKSGQIMEEVREENKNKKMKQVNDKTTL
ncbi:hypothetical protein [Anaerorhabdus sp.]|uniref:hypothetical protein n=3 Tax=Anaerorhabdus sp. TaxID=1872524 RepID=UPI002FCA474C